MTWGRLDNGVRYALLPHHGVPGRVALVLFFLLPGCASYTSATRVGLEAFQRRDYAAADKVYEKADE